MPTHQKLARNAAGRLDNLPSLATKGTTISAGVRVNGADDRAAWVSCERVRAGRWTIWISDTDDADSV